MPYVTDKDYVKLAEAVADDLINNGIPLNDSISKLAQSMQLSQEQIKRLCESSNNVTFNKMFQKKAGADDRMVEFDIADSKAVLGNAIKTAEARLHADEVLAYELRELEDETHVLRHPEPDFSATKTASFDLRKTAAPCEEVDRRALGKVLEHMRIEKISADMQYRDALVELNGRFKYIYDVLPFEEFEKQAVARFGSAACVPLADLRILMNKPAVTYNYDLLQKQAGLVDDSTREMKLLSSLVDYHGQRAKLDKGIAKLENVL